MFSSTSAEGIPSFLVSLQRLGARAVVNDFLVATVFGPKANDNELFNGHLGFASTLVGEFEKLVADGTIKSVGAAVSDDISDDNDNDADKNLRLAQQITKDISQYAITSAALPAIITSGAGLAITNHAGVSASPDATTDALVSAAKFLYQTTASYYDYFNEDEKAPIPLDIFTRVYVAALSSSVAASSNQSSTAVTTAANGNTALSFLGSVSSAASAQNGTAVPSFAARLSSFLKSAQIQLQKASAGAIGEEDPDVEIPFHHLAAIVDLILHHFPSALFVKSCCIPVGDASVERSGDEDAIRIIGGMRRLKRLQQKNKNKSGGDDFNDNAAGDSSTQHTGPLLAASARAKTAREVFAEEQARKAGIKLNNAADEDESMMGPLHKARQQATFDEAKTAAFEIEVNDNIPTFLKDVARKTYINYRRAPINLAEKKEEEAQMAIRKNLSNANAAGGSAGGGPSSMLALAENQEKRNAERRRIRAIERKRQEADAAAEAAANGNNQQQRNGGEDQQESNVVFNEMDNKFIVETKLTEGELEANDLNVGEGVRSEKDINSLPPWLRNAAAGSGGKVQFGYQTSQSIEEQRKSLPVYASREKIVEYVKTHSVTILQGETGSGKTTQIPQYLCDAGFNKRDPSDPYYSTNAAAGSAATNNGMRQREDLMIAITQPRRVAAIELAKRVAKERGTRCGDEVGYTVRFDDQTSDRTKIKYMTDGMLLREALLDDQFTRYSVIILDEAHERSINTDVLFGVLKKAIAKRPSLKLVITSATIELDRFCQYFGVSERFEIEGRTFPVDIKYLDTPCDDYVEKAVNTALMIHLSDKELKGDILIFLTGEDEINSAMDRLQSRFTALREKAKRELPPERHPYDLLILPCYATVPNEAMSKVFDKTPPRCRKIVVSTNVAETSITIDGLFYVIDSGFCKQHVYDPKNKVEELKIVPVSQAQATQRTGRAGRTNAGSCYRLFTRDQFEKEMTPATVPEIQRTNLINIVLTLKAVGFDDLLEFDFLDPPPKETLVNSLQTLRYLGALDDDGLLTPIGEKMSSLPLPPAESKTLLASIDFGCAPTVMTIVSMMGQRKVFFTPADKREEADFAQRQLKHPDGDQLTLANVYNSWVESGMSEKWCKANFVNPRACVEARRARDQLQQMLSQRHNITKDSKDSVAIRKALTSGYFFQVAKRGGDRNMYVTMSDRRVVGMHPSSSLFEQNPQYVVYHQLSLKKTKEYMMEVMRIEPQWLVELAPAFYAKPKEGELTKEQKAMRVDPILRPWDSKNSWRISKLKKKQ